MEISPGFETSARQAGRQLRRLVRLWEAVHVSESSFNDDFMLNMKRRQSLKGNWGVVDVQDAINAARALSTPSSRSPPIVDAKRLVIRGGSAGGYTVLASLSLPAADADLCIFAAGTSMYGISDLKKLCEGSHKFESRYLEKLVGGTWDEIPDVYKARSPLEKAGRIKRPLLVRLSCCALISRNI
jgi:dipeptidyl aminopeptidase/acylaminoacyl peptidase